MYALGPIRGGIGIRLAFKALTAQALNTSYGVGGVFAEQTPQEEGRDEDESRGAVRGQGRGKISWRPMNCQERHAAIRAARAAGLSAAEVAERLGVSRQHVYRVAG